MTPGVLAGLLAALAALLWAALDQRMPARGAGLLLLAGTMLALIRPPRLGWTWRDPAPWLLAAVAFQALAWTWTTVPDAGSFRVVERAAALFTAWGLATWLAGREVPRILGAAGATVLLLNVLGQCTWQDMPLGIALGLGQDPPFGNPNFNTGAALPLLAVGLFQPARRDLPLLLAGAGAALVLGLGAVNGDGNRAALVGLLVTLGMVGVLRLPRPWRLPVLLGALALGLGLAVTLAVTWWYPQVLGPSTGFRIATWHAAVSGWMESPWWGHGPAAGLTVINRQEAYQFAWMAVPGYTEHSHAEPLEVLVDGGVLLMGLLLTGLTLLLRPLWHLQHHPLLTGWAVALTLGCLESHYGQPGPLLGLAVLAGATWAVLPAPPPTPGGMLRLPLALGAGALAVSLVLETRWDPASDQGHSAPPVREGLVRRRIDDARERQDWPAVEHAATRLHQHLGPLTDLWLLRAEAVARQGRTAEVPALVAGQRAVLPLLPGYLDLLDRLDRRGLAPESPHEARRRVRAILERWAALGWIGKDPRLVPWLETWVQSTP